MFPVTAAGPSRHFTVFRLPRQPTKYNSCIQNKGASSQSFTKNKDIPLISAGFGGILIPDNVI
jgi:hypothetical protein